MRRDGYNHVTVVRETRHQPNSIIAPLCDSLIVANVKWDIDDTKLPIIKVVLGEGLLHDSKVRDVPDRVKVEVEEDSRRGPNFGTGGRFKGSYNLKEIIKDRLAVNCKAL